MNILILMIVLFGLMHSNAEEITKLNDDELLAVDMLKSRISTSLASMGARRRTCLWKMCFWSVQRKEVTKQAVIKEENPTSDNLYEDFRDQYKNKIRF